MMGIGEMVYFKELEIIHGLIIVAMLAISVKVLNMDKENIHQKMVEFFKEFGRMANEMARDV